MRRIFTMTFMTVFAALLALTATSCKKREVKKIVVDNQFAISLFNDTVLIKDLINDMDSTTNSWLRVNEDGSLSAYYADTINGVLKASDMLGGLEDIDFTTSTGFTMPWMELTNVNDTTVDVEKFMTVPFNYDGFNIEEVIIRKGVMSFGFEVNLEADMLRRIELYSNDIVSPSGETLVIAIDYNNKGDHSVDLSDYHVYPVDDTVAFGARVTLHCEGIYEGGDYECVSSGGLTGVGFKTVYAIVTKSLDSIFDDSQDIDFGINGLSGSAMLPVPTIAITYRNTFGLTASGDFTKMDFYSGKTGQITDFLIGDHVDIDIEPTNGEYRSFIIEGFQEEIDALAGYTRLDFSGALNMAMPGEHISISDTSTVDVIANVDMPMSFKISDMRYMDTIALSLGDGLDDQSYLDEVRFIINTFNQIPLEVRMQGLFVRNNHVIDSLFDAGPATIEYNEASEMVCVIDGDKLHNVTRADHLILRLNVTTDFDRDPVMVTLRESDGIALRMRMRTKTSEINLDDIL